MYIPLRISSSFSIGTGSVRPEEITKFLKTNAIPAAGVADRDTLSGAMTIAQTLRKSALQALSGVCLKVSFAQDSMRTIEGDIVLYAANQAGFEAMLSLVNPINTNPDHPALGWPQLIETLDRAGNDLIVLTGGMDGVLSSPELSDDVAQTMLQNLVSSGATVFIEIERDGISKSDVEPRLMRLADQFGLPMVATSRADYLTPDDIEAHDAYMCIVAGDYVDNPKRKTAAPGRHLASAAEMAERFADIPEALDNTIALARMAGFMMEPVAPKTPSYPLAGSEGEAARLSADAREGLASRLEAGSSAPRKEYEDRLEYELSVIERMGFPGYFLIVAEFIGWAKSQGIAVGPGRGSGAGSLVAYALGITDIDPLQFGLLFERFLNPDRVSMPDFDIDFCPERREEVIEHVREVYGAERVAHIAAYGTLQARAAVKAVGRTMQIPYPVVERFAALIPQNPADPIDLAGAIQQPALAEEIRNAEPRIREMFEIALRVEGLYSHVSTHAAGVIIADAPIANSVPVHIDAHGKLATSFEMKAAEQAGLVKFDFLGLKNLDIIDKAVRMAARVDGAEIDFDTIGFDDPEVFEALAKGDGFAVFQLESAGMRRAMRDLHVDHIEDLIALISLYRPGPMDQIETYASVKSGETAPSYLHSSMKEVLEETNGVMIYQEQVMEIARRAAGFSLGEADLLRRAMGKKIASEMDAQRERFAKGAAAGWIEVALDDGSTRRVHALEEFALTDGSGKVSAAEAFEKGLEIAI